MSYRNTASTTLTDFIKHTIIPRLDILEVCHRAGLVVKKAGASYKACCPFHNEKTPSFTIYPHQNSYYCFGCGETGDSLSLMRHTMPEFTFFFDALKEACHLTGVDYPESLFSGKDSMIAGHDPIARYYELNEGATQFYTAQLMQAPHAIEYLTKERGLTMQSISQFRIGYAPNSWDALKQYLKQRHNATDNELLTLGLCAEGGRAGGKVFDSQRNRIITPIINSHGMVVAFNGRSLDDANVKPKYLHTKASPLFDKSKTLYNFNQVVRKKCEAAILTEGAFDAIAVQQAITMHDGSNTKLKKIVAVAALGTGISKEHISALFKHSSKILICADGDEAGRKATRRALEKAVLPAINDDSMKEVKFLILPQGYDADSYIKQYGLNGFFVYARQHTLSLSDYITKVLITQNIELKNITPEVASKIRARIENEILPMIEEGMSNAHHTAYYQTLVQHVKKYATNLLGHDVGSSVAKKPQRQARVAKIYDHDMPYIEDGGQSNVQGRIASILTAYPELQQKVGMKNISAKCLPYFGNIEQARTELFLLMGVDFN